MAEQTDRHASLRNRLRLYQLNVLYAEEVAALLAERDELLAACESAMAAIDDSVENNEILASEWNRTIVEVRAALARANSDGGGS